MTTIPTYYVENSWCYIDVEIKRNNTYWIDWSECEEIIEQKHFNATDFTNFKFKQTNTNILCVCNGIYGFYNTSDNSFYEFNPNFKIVCVNNIDIKKGVNKLNLEYEEKLFIV